MEMTMKNMVDKKCLWCGGEFEKGFTSDMGRSRLMIWIENEPQSGRLWRGVVPRDRRMYRIESYRCKGCGYMAQFTSSQWSPYSNK
jgi:hypothetical protein